MRWRASGFAARTAWDTNATVNAWQEIATAHAPDGARLELLRRGGEYLIRAGGYDLMSSEDASSSRALAELGCAHLSGAAQGRVLVGGLGMGFTARAALAATGRGVRVDVAELVPAVVDWNRAALAALADHPLDDPRTELLPGDVADIIEAARARYDAVLLDVDNGPDALAHDGNERLYSRAGIAATRRALRAGGVLAVWSYSDDPSFTRRLRAHGFTVGVERVLGSKKGRGRHHYVWVARAPEGTRT